MSEVDTLFARARAADSAAFVDWVGSVELPIRLSLRRFARAVDVESTLQETFLRMWVLAQDSDRTLEGEDASVRFAIRMARNLALAEARRLGKETLLPPEDLPEIAVPPDPTLDPGLMLAIRECVEKLSKKPFQALHARLQWGAMLLDRELAERVGMTLNTFLQNITRARKLVLSCLERRGIPLDEVLS